MEAAIELDHLSKSYGRRRGLVDLSLQVRRGEVFGYLGPNGAGKSTTIRLLLDLIRPDGGRARVLGLDPRRDAVAVHRRVGYLAGDFVVDPRQCVDECLTFLANLRGGVPRDRISDLAEQLDLELPARIKTLSKGNRQKVGLVQAFMHRPELLILDEPTSGLDPLVQQTFLRLVTEARAAGQTVLMSSHVMSEVERVADRVGIIREGRLIALDTVAGLRDRAVRTMRITFAEPPPVDEFAGLPGVGDLRLDGAVLHCRVAGSPDALLKAVAQHTVIDLLSEEPDLEDLFLTFYEGRDRVAA
ncbi:ABC transporter ATP-binding protein [Amycolatopsis sp. NPDC051758]|uniref:ABC transporter ATP-binding protein n=1 Tax=Amycolatopsis sp. NPDC051758 TaxID=3363935 RepID=UPI0037A87851